MTDLAGWRIKNYSELHTQEAEDEDNRQGLALTGNSPIGGTHAYHRLQTPEETPEGTIELHFAKQGLDVRVEAINCDNRTLTFSARSDHDYVVAKEYLKNEGWTATFDSKRVRGLLASHFAKQRMDIQIESLNFEAKIITISALGEDTYKVAQEYLRGQGWEVTFDPKRIPVHPA